METALNANHLQFLLHGAAWTVGLSLIAFAGGGLFGLAVALCRVARSRAVRIASAGYVQLVQGTPLLVILFMTFFGLPSLGLKISPLAAAGISLTIYVSAYLGEIWRGCIESVPRSQWEAAECLALTRIQRMRLVILPQAVRIATPPTVGFMVQIVKNTSLASVVGFVELARSGQIINNSVFEPFLVFVIIGVIYFALCYPLSQWSQRLERRSARTRGPAVLAAEQPSIASPA
ncbi:amino acid ABC transporter permease [Acidovorax sp.]|uniref:amino acid ABC transporter permease n=1 Tax=Acidovorax sp. TaxID=1872122 RepID=UPI002603477B|nr:amino acid ABC transporter permease [Acidovorax sp.]